MVALSDRFKAWDVLAIGLNVLLLFCSCRLLLGYPCLCQGSPVHLTCTKPENTPTYLKKTHTYRRYHTCSETLFIRAAEQWVWKMLSWCMCITHLDLAGAGKTASIAAGSEATAARAVLPDPTSLSSGFTPETSKPPRFQFAPSASLLLTRL